LYNQKLLYICNRKLNKETTKSKNMKSYNENYEVKERKSIVFYEVLYNNEDTIEFTSNYNKAIKKAKECAKCNDSNGDFYVVNAICGENVMHIVSYHVKKIN